MIKESQSRTERELPQLNLQRSYYGHGFVRVQYLDTAPVQTDSELLKKAMLLEPAARIGILLQW